jgi:hypothetical protein
VLFSFVPIYRDIIFVFRSVFYASLIVDPLLGNGIINMHSSQQKRVLSMESVLKSYLEGNGRYGSQ